MQNKPSSRDVEFYDNHDDIASLSSQLNQIEAQGSRLAFWCCSFFGIFSATLFYVSLHMHKESIRVICVSLCFLLITGFTRRKVIIQWFKYHELRFKLDKWWNDHKNPQLFYKIYLWVQEDQYRILQLKRALLPKDFYSLKPNLLPLDLGGGVCK